MVTTVSLAVLVSTNARLELSLRARSIQSTLTCAQSAALALTYVRQRLSAWDKAFYLELQLRRFGFPGPLFSCRLAGKQIMAACCLLSKRQAAICCSDFFLSAGRCHFTITLQLSGCLPPRTVTTFKPWLSLDALMFTVFCPAGTFFSHTV